MKKIIYISGPMSGIENHNAAAFNDAQRKLEELGHVVLNPAVNPAGLTYQQYMTIDFAMLSVCNTIYMLTGHKNSPGAKAELAYAHSCNFNVVYQSAYDSVALLALQSLEELSTENVDN